MEAFGGAVRAATVVAGVNGRGVATKALADTARSRQKIAVLRMLLWTRSPMFAEISRNGLA